MNNKKFYIECVSELKVIFMDNNLLITLDYSTVKIEHIMYFIIELINKYIDTQKDLILKLFKLALTMNPNTYDCMIMAQYISSSKYLDNKKWARQIYYKALCKAEGSGLETCDIANSISNDNYLGDKRWAKNIYLNAIWQSTNRFETFLLTVPIKENKTIKNKKWVRQFLKEKQQYEKKHLESNNQELNIQKIYFCKYSNIEDMLLIVRKILTINKIKYKSMAKIILKNTITVSKNSYEIYDIVQIIAHKKYLNDRIWAKKLYKKILNDKYIQHIHPIIVKDVVSKKYLNDKKFGLKIYRQLLLKANSIEEILEIIKNKKLSKKTLKNPYKYLI